MVRLVRGAVVAFLAVFVALAGALPSSAEGPSPVALRSETAEPVYGCIDKVDGYGAPRACQLNVLVKAPVCDNDVPKLNYRARGDRLAEHHDDDHLRDPQRS